MTAGFNHAASGGVFYKVNSLSPHGSVVQASKESEANNVVEID